MTEPNKVKAIDINTESLKLYITIAIGSIAGLIAYHNSPNIDHNETAFKLTLGSFLLSAIISVVTLNAYVILVDNNKIEVLSKLPVWLNRFAIIFFILGLVCVGFYLGLSNPKTKIDSPPKEINGIVIQGDRVEIGNKVKTQIKITKDSAGRIREIVIPKSFEDK